MSTSSPPAGRPNRAFPLLLLILLVGGGIAATFDQVYPIPGVGDTLLAPARRKVAEANVAAASAAFDAEEAKALFKPYEVYWCDGSKGEYQHMLKALVACGFTPGR